MKRLFNKSTKTSITGVFIAILTYLLATNTIDTNMYVMAMGILSAFGFVVAKDGNKTGV